MEGRGDITEGFVRRGYLRRVLEDVINNKEWEEGILGKGIVWVKMWGCVKYVGKFREWCSWNI